jgi:uncharacterized protein (TIGR03435 family)
MEIFWTRTKSIMTVCALLLAGVAWGVKHFYFPTVDEKFFQLDYQRLQSAPPNIFIFRPTHFAAAGRSGAMSASSPNQAGRYNPDEMRLLGRNAGVKETIALAYQCQPSRVVLPGGAPTNRYDFLVTTKKPNERLQKAVQHRFGYTARWQERETDVLELKVRMPGVLHPSGTNNSPGSEYKGGKLILHHAPVQWLAGMIEDLFGKPVMDQTGLTGYYDFEIAWDWRGRRADPDKDALNRSLNELGLGLTPGSETMQMMVVERAR